MCHCATPARHDKCVRGRAGQRPSMKKKSRLFKRPHAWAAFWREGCTRAERGAIMVRRQVSPPSEGPDAIS